MLHCPSWAVSSGLIDEDQQPQCSSSFLGIAIRNRSKTEKLQGKQKCLQSAVTARKWHRLTITFGVTSNTDSCGSLATMGAQKPANLRRFAGRLRAQRMGSTSAMRVSLHGEVVFGLKSQGILQNPFTPGSNRGDDN